MTRIYLFLLLLFLLLPAGICAQSNRIVDEILNSSEMDLFHSAYILSYASGRLPENETPEGFTGLLASANDYFLDFQPDYTLNTAEFSLALMTMLEIKGGVMYSIFHSPRYAFREMISKGIIDKESSASSTISGETVLNIIQKAMKWKEMYI